MFVLFCIFKKMTSTEFYTLSLHDALPISQVDRDAVGAGAGREQPRLHRVGIAGAGGRSEEHTSELQSQFHLVCRPLLEKIKHPASSLYPAVIAVSVPVNIIPFVVILAVHD